MGQYFIIVNETKKEYLHPHKFDDGLKLLEFGLSSYGTLFALALLLRQGVGEDGDFSSGGGDYTSPLWHKFVRPQYDNRDELTKHGKSFEEASDMINMSIKHNTPKELWEYLGHWVGDAIAIVGDYDESKRWAGVYDGKGYTDISHKVIPMVNFIKNHDGVGKEREDKSIRPDIVLSL